MDLLTRTRTLLLLSLIAAPPLLGVVPGWVSIALVPLAVSALLALIQLSWLVGRARAKEPPEPIGLAWYDVALLLFLLLLPLSLRQAIEPLTSLELLAWWGGGITLYFLLPRLLARPGEAEAVYAGIVGIAACAAAFSLPAVLPSGPELCGFCTPVIGHHRNLTALYLLPCFFLALWRFVAARSRLRTAAYAICLLAIGSYLIFSRCRAVWLALVPGLAYLALQSATARSLAAHTLQRVRRRAGLAALVGAAALAGALALAPLAPGPLVESRLFLTATTLLHPTEGSAGGRLQLWRAGAAMVADHLGAGVGLAHWKQRFHPYRNAFGPAPHETYVPLNSFLRLLGEIGLFRMALFLVFLGGILAGIPGRSFEVRSLQVALAAMLFAACFHVTLFDPSLLLMLWVTLGLLRRHGSGRALPVPRPLATAAGSLVLLLLLGATALEAAATKAKVYGYILGPFVDYSSGRATLQAPGVYAWVLPYLGRVTEDLAYREHAPALRRLARLDSGSSPGIHATLAAKEQGYGAFAEALTWAEAARARSPQDPLVHARLCEIQLELARLAEAATSCRTALELDPYAPEPSRTLAAIQEAAGNAERALATRLETRTRYDGRIARHLGLVSLQADVAEWHEGRTANEQALRDLRRRLGRGVPATETLEAIAGVPTYNKSIVVDSSKLWFSGTATGAFSLWSHDLATGRTRLESNDRLSYFRLRRSGDTAPLFFVSDHDGDYRYALYARDPGEEDGARQLTSRSWGASVAEFEPSPDGAFLAYVEERGRDEALFLLDTKTLTARRLTQEGGSIADLAWAPSSAGLFFVQDRSRLVRYDLPRRRLETLVHVPGHEIRWPGVAPSGARVSFVVRDAEERSAIWEHDLASGESVALTHEEDATFLSPIWLDEERLLYRRQIDDTFALGVLTRSSRELASLGPTHGVVYEVAIAPDRRTLYFFYGDARTPVSLHRLHLDTGALEQVEDPSWLGREAILEHRTYTLEAMGGTLRVYVYTPPGAGPAARRPCVIWLGGSGGYSPRWNPYTQYLAHAGFVVAAFNYSGLPGSPRRVLRAPPEVTDALHAGELAAVHALLAGLPEADPSRTALVGVSRGARVVEAGLLGRPGLFRAGVELAGPPTDLLDVPRPGLTPLLFVLGRNDAYVPLARKEAQAALQRAAGNELEILVLDREGHDLRGRQNVQAALERTVAFLRTALGARSP